MAKNVKEGRGQGGEGRGDKGACGGERRQDGSSKGSGNRGTTRQPPKR